MKNQFISPKDLAKRTKSTARTVSLRIKDKTWFGFEKLAEEHKTTANLLISELADTYIESLNSELQINDEEVQYKKLEAVLKKALKKSLRLPDSDILLLDDIDMPRWYHTDAHGMTMLQALEKCAKANKEHYHWVDPRDHEQIYNVIMDCDTTIIIPIDGKAQFKPGVEDNVNLSVSHLINGSLLEIPYQKWPIVQHLLKTLNDERNKIGLLQHELDYDDMDAIVKIVNEEDDRSKLANGIVEIIMQTGK